MSDDAKKRLGERVRKIRRDADITQIELAQRLKVTQGVISNVENGVSTIDAPDLPEWAQALGVPIMAFFLDETRDLRERAELILSMFPEDRLPFVMQMLENMARAMRQDKAD